MSGSAISQDSDNDALRWGILMSVQQEKFGINMLDSLNPADEEEIRALQSRGLKRNDAALIIFERRFGRVGFDEDLESTAASSGSGAPPVWNGRSGDTSSRTATTTSAETSPCSHTVSGDGMLNGRPIPQQAREISTTATDESNHTYSRSNNYAHHINSQQHHMSDSNGNFTTNSGSRGHGRKGKQSEPQFTPEGIRMITSPRQYTPFSTDESVDNSSFHSLNSTGSCERGERESPRSRPGSGRYQQLPSGGTSGDPSRDARDQRNSREERHSRETRDGRDPQHHYQYQHHSPRGGRVGGGTADTEANSQRGSGRYEYDPNKSSSRDSTGPPPPLPNFPQSPASSQRRHYQHQSPHQTSPYGGAGDEGSVMTSISATSALSGTSGMSRVSGGGSVSSMRSGGPQGQFSHSAPVLHRGSSRRNQPLTYTDTGDDRREGIEGRHDPYHSHRPHQYPQPHNPNWPGGYRGPPDQQYPIRRGMYRESSRQVTHSFMDPHTSEYNQYYEDNRMPDSEAAAAERYYRSVGGPLSPPPPPPPPRSSSSYQPHHHHGYPQQHGHHSAYNRQSGPSRPLDRMDSITRMPRYASTGPRPGHGPPYHMHGIPEAPVRHAATHFFNSNPHPSPMPSSGRGMQRQRSEQQRFFGADYSEQQVPRPVQPPPVQPFPPAPPVPPHQLHRDASARVGPGVDYIRPGGGGLNGGRLASESGSGRHDFAGGGGFASSSASSRYSDVGEYRGFQSSSSSERHGRGGGRGR